MIISKKMSAAPYLLDQRAQRTARRIPARPRRAAAAPRGTASPADAGSSIPASATRDAWPNRSATTAGPSPATRRPARSSPARRSTPPANTDTASRRTMSTMPHDRCEACLRRPVNYAPRHHSTLHNKTTRAKTNEAQLLIADWFCSKSIFSLSFSTEEKATVYLVDPSFF